MQKQRKARAILVSLTAVALGTSVALVGANPAMSAEPIASEFESVLGLDLAPGVTLSSDMQKFILSLPASERADFVSKRLAVGSGSYAGKPRVLTGAERAELVAKKQVNGLVAADVCYDANYAFWHTAPAGNKITEMGYHLKACYTSGGTAKSSVMSDKWGHGNWGWLYHTELKAETGIVYNQARGSRNVQFVWATQDGWAGNDVLCGMGVLKWGRVVHSYTNDCTLY